MKIKLLVGTFLAIVTGICLAKEFIFHWSPQYTAQAEYSINWDQMAAGEKDFKPQKARRAYNNGLAKFKVSDQLISQLCENCNLPDSQYDSIARNLDRYLSITHIGKSEAGDLYRVQFADDKGDVALKAVNLLSRRQVAKVNDAAKVRSGMQTISSFKDNADARDKEQELRDERATLIQNQNQSPNAETQARIDEIQEQLNQNDLDQMQSGFYTFLHGVGIFTNPAKIRERGTVEAN